MTAHARLDANRTAQPRTRIVHHPPRGGRIGPHMPLVNPEYEDENGSRVPLTAPALVHFPSSRAGFTWCGQRLDIPDEMGISDGAQADRAGVLFATNLPVVTCLGCQADEPAPLRETLTPSEVALSKMLVAWEEWPGLGSVEDIRHDEAARTMMAFGVILREYGLVEDVDMVTQITDRGRALLDRARKAGVL